MSTQQSPYTRKSKIEKRVSQKPAERQIPELFYTKNGDNSIWDDVNDISVQHDNAKGASATTLTYVCEAIKKDGFVRHIKDPKKLTESIQAVTGKFNEYCETSDKIKEMHKDKSGVAKTQNEHALALDVGVKYFELTEKFENELHPLIVDVSRQINEAEVSYADEVKSNKID